MAKYLDYNGVKYLWQKMLARFSKKGHTHTITPTKGASVTVTAGTAASLTTTNISIPNITKKTVVTGGTKTAIPNISVETKSIPNVTSAGTAATASVSQGVLTLTNGTAPTLGTDISVGSASAGTAIEAYTTLSTGDSITLGTAMSAKAVDTFTPNTPTAVTSKTVVTDVTATNASTD